MKPAVSRSLRWLLLASLVLVTLGVGVALSVYLSLFVLAMMIYGWVALTRTRTAAPEECIAVRLGSRWGCCAAAYHTTRRYAGLTLSST